MGNITKESIQQMLDEERKRLIQEVKERVEKRKSLMASEQVNDYNFFKRRSSID